MDQVLRITFPVGFQVLILSSIIIFSEKRIFSPAVLIFFICYFTDNNIVILLTMGPVIPL